MSTPHYFRKWQAKHQPIAVSMPEIMQAFGFGGIMWAIATAIVLVACL